MSITEIDNSGDNNTLFYRKQYRFGKNPQIVVNFHVETVTKILTIKVNGITKYQNSQGNRSY